MLTRMSFLFLLIFAILIPVAQPARAVDQKPVLAYYFPWYEQSDWSTAKMADLPATTYSGGDDAAIARHIQQAAASGIDGFICTWFGPNEPRLTDRSPSGQGRSGPQLRHHDCAGSVRGLHRDAQNAGRHGGSARCHARSLDEPPSWLRWDGKPVVVFWNPQSFGPVSAWQALRAQIDPNHTWHWIGEGTDFSYLDVFDSLYYIDISWAANPADALVGYGRRLDDYNRSHNASKPFIATVMPGYDDSRVRNTRCPRGERRLLPAGVADRHRQTRAGGHHRLLERMV